VFSKSKIFKFLKRDCGTIPVAEIINGKIEFFSKHQRFLIATESSKYLLIFVLYVCVIQSVAQLTPQRKLTCADSNNITGKTDSFFLSAFLIDLEAYQIHQSR
jgi:hypothetical protein